MPGIFLKDRLGATASPGRSYCASLLGLTDARDVHVDSDKIAFPWSGPKSGTPIPSGPNSVWCWNDQR